MTDTDWTNAFAGLHHLSPEILDDLRAGAKVVPLAEGARVFGPGKAPTHYLMLLEGTVRVSQLSEQGREIVLYRIHAGESCALTTACLIGFEDYLATAVVEERGRAVALPRESFDALIARSSDFRRFVFRAFSTRITDLFRVVEEVAFRRIDIRLAQRLLERSDADGRVTMTHQQLAAELGSAREVISRQLREFQRLGWVEAHRGVVSVHDAGALAALARAP